MPFMDYLRRLFGMGDSDLQSPRSPHHRFDEVDRKSLELDVREYKEPLHPPAHSFEDDFFEQHINQLENFFRNLPFFGSFGFGSPDHLPNQDPFFGSPFGFGMPDHPPHQEPPYTPMDPFGPSCPDSGGFSFFGFPNIFDFPDIKNGHKGIFGPTMERQEDLSPRDEVLKPSYRSSNNHEFKDEDYDDLVKRNGPDVILDMLKKSEEAHKNNERRLVPVHPHQLPAHPHHPSDVVPRSYNRFSSTKFSFVNGESVQEQITRLPDGTFEKKVTRTNSKGETNTVVSHHTEDEIAPSMRGGFGLFGGFGPRLW